MLRKLVTVQKIEKIIPIEGADFVELVKILGWQCVAKKGEFQEGDLCVYFEVDSFLPESPRFEFLRGSSFRQNEVMGKGFRIKTAKMRGHVSQGLALSVDQFPEIINPQVGDDVTEILGVVKWEMPEVLGSAGIAIGDKPWGIPTTDELRVQSIPEIIEEFQGQPYYISTKMDGTSFTIAHHEGEVVVCGRNFMFKEDVETCSMWAWVKEMGLDEKLRAFGNAVLQGEFCGPGVQKNPLQLKKGEVFFFNGFTINGFGMFTPWTLGELMDNCEQLGVKTVPIEEVGNNFTYTFDELLARAEGVYSSGRVKEGIVIRSTDMSAHSKRMSFKVINNQFLLKEKG